MLMSPGEVTDLSNDRIHAQFYHHRQTRPNSQQGEIRPLPFDGALPIRIDGRPLVKKVICNAFTVAYNEMEPEYLQVDDIRVWMW